MSQSPLSFVIDGDIAVLTLNRPDAGNTIDMAMANALLDAAIRCDSDRNIRCVVLTGQGKLFCGGGDVGSFSGAGENVSGFLSELAGKLHMALSRFMRMRKPLVTLVNGPAAGAGMSLALAGDIVIACPAARFVAAYGAIGLTPDGGMSWLLPRLVGLRQAQELLITNRPVKADEAVEIGFVTRLVEADDLLDVGLEQARGLAHGAVNAMGGVRDLLLSTFSESYEGQLEREARLISASGDGSEAREGISAFLAKRAPDFKRRDQE